MLLNFPSQFTVGRSQERPFPCTAGGFIGGLLLSSLNACLPISANKPELAYQPLGARIAGIAERGRANEAPARRHRNRTTDNLEGWLHPSASSRLWRHSSASRDRQWTQPRADQSQLPRSRSISQLSIDDTPDR